MTLSNDLLEILACPQCKGVVNYLPAVQEIRCDLCRLAFPARHNIPVMLIDEARALTAPADGKTTGS